MANQPNLRVRLSADLDDIKKGMALLRGDFAKLKKDAAGATPSTAGWRQGLADVRTQLAGVVSLYAVMRGARWYLDQADQAANLSARLRLATKSQDEFTRAQQGTYAIAQRTSAEWGSVVGLYAQLAQSTGMGQERILALTETISQAFQVSGASAEETSNGLRQLQQAMAGGVLRAEEFNTIIETSPRIVQAMADYFGIAFGDVRKYVNDGKVSSEQFAQALLKGSAEIQRDFNKLPLTVSRATQQVRNALLGMVGDADSASGASSELATNIQDLARTLESPEVQRGFTSIVTALSQVVTWTVKATAELGNMLGQYREMLANSGLVEGRTIEQLQARRQQLAEFRGTARGQTWNMLGGYVDKEIVKVGQLIAELEERQRVLMSDEQDIPESMLRQQDRPGSTAAAGKAGKAVAASNALMRDTVSRALAELERLYKGNEVSLEEYFATRQRLAEQAIDLEIEQARNELAVTKDLGARRKLEEQITILQRDRAEVAATAAQEQKAAEEDLEKALAGVTLRLKELRGESVSVERAKLETEFQELKNLLRKNGREAGVAMVDELIDGLVAKARSEELKRAASEIANTLQGKESSISAQVSGGMLGYGEGERQIAEARATALVGLQQLRAAAAASLANLTEGTPEHKAVLAGIEAIDTQIATINASQMVWRQRIEDLGASAFGSFLTDLVEGAKSFKDAFADMVRSFVAGVAQMIAQEMALRAMRTLLSSFGGGGGISAGVAHTGAKVGQWTMRRTVSPLVFGSAPRYHSGGIAGLKPDEVPAILQTGERVLSRRQTAAYDAAVAGASGSGGAGVVTTPIVAIGDDAVANALAGAAGERVVMTHVRNNMEAIQRGG